MPSFNRLIATLALMLGSLVLATGANARSAMAVSNPEPGVHLMGSDKAKFTLTEYVSYTCPHCSHFEDEGGDALRVFYVGSGKIKLEVRHIVRDPVDLVAAMLTNCGPVSRFDRNHAMFMRTQPTWLGKLRKATQAQINRYSTGPYAVRRQAIAHDAGFYEMMRTRGYEAVEVDRCLADDDMAKALAEKTRSYVDGTGVMGTPSFAIDHVLLAGTSDWKSLKFQLDLRL